MSREKSDKVYERYLESPDGLTGEQLRLALDYQDTRPVEALNIRRRREAERREPVRGRVKELSAERRKAALAEAENEALAASLRDWRDW